MTHYDEFGVSPTASTDEIREAYRQLAKLLHPDTIQNEKQRAVAACQMRRLNQVYETLIDPERRWSYDLGLRRPQRMEAPEPRTIAAFKLDPVSLWPLTGLLALITAFLLSGAEATPKKDTAAVLHEQAQTLRSAVCPQETPPPIAAVKLSLPGRDLTQLRRENALLAGERNQAVSRLAAAEASLHEMQSRLLESSRPSTVPVSIVPREARPQISPPPRDSLTDVDGDYIPPNHDSPLAGVWYYAKAGKEAGTRELFPPEFIEAVIVEESGMMRGRYRARYRVSDPAISPDVSFSFSGGVGQSAASFSWLGAEGARGEVRFRLLTKNTIEVAWIASRLGTSPGLGSGKAVLLRKADR